MNSETTETIAKDAADAAITAIHQPEDSRLEIASYLDRQIQEKLESMNLTTAQTKQVLTIIHDTVRPEITKLTAMWNGMDWTYAVQFIAFAVLFYLAFKILKENLLKRYR